MLGKEQMQSFTVDDEAQEEWASEVRRFHDSAKIEVVDILGQSHTLLEIDTETSSWPLFRVQAVSIVLSTPSRNTRWPCTCGPTTLLHIRVDGRGQIEVWSGTVAVAKYFDVEASPEDWVPGLVHVDASRVRDLATLLASDHASMLRSLDMGGAGLLVDLKPIEQLFGLVLLNLHSCENISNLGPLTNLNNLTSLNLSGCKKIHNLAPLEKLSKLTSLDLSRCSEIVDFSPLANLKQLISLILSGCEELKEIGSLASLTKLTSLNLASCRNVSDFSPLIRLSHLTSLVLWNCEKISDLSFLTELTQLTSLVLWSCDEIKCLAPLACLTQLISLDLSCCMGINDLSPLASLAQLNVLDLSSCTRLSRLAPIAALPSLYRLDLTDCANIRDADTLCDSAALYELEYDETATRDIVLLASAVRRGDADLADCTNAAAASFELSKTPDLHGLHLVSAVNALGARAEDQAEVLRAVAEAFRTRGEVPRKTWGALFAEIVRTPDLGLRPAFEIALEDLPLSEIERVLGPALIALADTPASARGWALDLVQQALLPVVASARHAREVAPAAAVFFHSQGRTADVDAWLERGSVAQVPAWRDRVLVALLSRALRLDEVLEARRLLGLVQTPERRDEARGMLVQHLAEKAEFRDAAAELDAIVDRARRASVAAQALERTAAFASESHAGLSLLLALDGDPDTLADVLTAMVQQAPDSELVRQLAVVFAPTAGVDLGEAVDALMAHESVIQRTRPRQLAGLRSRVRADRQLASRVLIHGTAALLEEEGLVDNEDTAELTAEMLDESD